ncbi:polymorphic toxin type 10 domain-containing protein [Sphingobacterium hotanense]
MFEFDTPSSGLSSLINRDNPRFVGFGLKTGGAGELQ